MYITLLYINLVRDISHLTNATIYQKQVKWCAILMVHYLRPWSDLIVSCW